MADLAETLLRRWGSLDADFQRHSVVWKACFDATFPHRGDGLQGDVIDASSAQNKQAELLDPTGTDGARMLASSILQGMTPANSVWFGLDVGDEDDEERRWLGEAAEQCWEAIHAANYDAAKFECVLDAVCAGWFVMFIDDDGDSLRFEQWPMAQCRIASSKPGGEVDTLFRRFKLTAEQAYNEYGDAVSDAVKADAENKPDTLHEFQVAIYPRKDFARGSLLPRNLPVASVHLECQGKRIVRESGFHEQPFVCPRLLLLPNTPYAIGPVSAALPAIRSLNELLRLEAAGLARAVAGVYVAENDGVLNPRTVKVKGGSVIVANSVDSIKELPSGSDFNAGFSKADQLRAEIRRLLMADQLPPVDSPTKTATEFHYRANLVRMLLGPVFGRFQSEDLAPTIRRVFGLLFRRGRPEIGGTPGPVLLDDPPESLRGLPFRVRFQSPLARAQKLEDVAATERLLLIGQSLAAMGKPEALDLIDADEVMRKSLDALGAPDDVLRGEEDTAAIREAQQRQQQQAMQQAQAMEVQNMAAKAALEGA